MEKKFFDEPIKNNLTAYDNIQKIAIGQEDNYTTGCLLDYNYFTKYNKMIATDLSKQQAVDIDLKAIQQINFTGNLAGNPIANDVILFCFNIVPIQNDSI